MFKGILIHIFGAVILVAAKGSALADPSADQIERAQLLRDLQESRPSAAGQSSSSGLPGARTDSNARGNARLDPLRRQQLEDSQWRSLLGAQQSQANAPASQSNSQSQWRSQSFGRERQAEDLSADILRRSREAATGHP